MFGKRDHAHISLTCMSCAENHAMLKSAGAKSWAIGANVFKSSGASSSLAAKIEDSDAKHLSSTGIPPYIDAKVSSKPG